MKRFKTITAATALIATLAACSNTENLTHPDDANRTALSINAGITAIVAPATRTAGTADFFPSGSAVTPSGSASAATRAENALWQSGDAIGILMLDAGTGTPTDGKTNYRYHTPDGTGTFLPDGAANTAYFPAGATPVDLIAYYPHTDALATTGTDAFVLPVDVSDQSDLAAIDLMTAPRTTGHSSTNPSVALAFSHRLCKLVLNVATDATTADITLAGATLALTGMPATARWNLLTEALTPGATAPSIALATTPAGTRATAILVPAPAAAGRTITLTTAGGQVFTATLASHLAFEPGTVNTYTLTLSRTNVTLSNVSIVDWIEGTYTGTIDTDDVQPDAIFTDITEAGELHMYAYKSGTVGIVATGYYPIIITDGIASIDKTSGRYSPIQWASLTEKDDNYTYGAVFFPTTDLSATNHETDILGGVSTTTAWGKRPTIALTHLMARLVVKLSCTDDTYTAEQLNAATLTVKRKVMSNGNYDITPTGVTVNTVDVPVEAVPVTLNKNADATFSATLCPQTLTESDTDDLLTLSITTPGGEAKKYTLKKAVTLKAGEVYTLTATLSASSLLPDAITVAPWDESATGDGNLEIQ